MKVAEQKVLKANHVAQRNKLNNGAKGNQNHKEQACRSTNVKLESINRIAKHASNIETTGRKNKHKANKLPHGTPLGFSHCVSPVLSL
jgi:hypothetical protein